MNKKVFPFLIALILINCENIKFAITIAEINGGTIPVNYIFNFIPNESDTSKDFVNKLKNQSPISVKFNVRVDGGELKQISTSSFPFSLATGNDFEQGIKKGEFFYDSDNTLFYYDVKGNVEIPGFIFGKEEANDDSLINF